MLPLKPHTGRYKKLFKYIFSSDHTGFQYIKFVVCDRLSLSKTYTCKKGNRSKLHKVNYEGVLHFLTSNFPPNYHVNQNGLLSPLTNYHDGKRSFLVVTLNMFKSTYFLKNIFIEYSSNS